MSKFPVTPLFLLIIAALLLSGTNRCQEDVVINFGRISTGTVTPTPDPDLDEGEDDEDGDDDIITLTPTPGAIATIFPMTPTPIESAEPTVAATSTPVEVSNLQGSGLSAVGAKAALKELSSLSESGTELTQEPALGLADELPNAMPGQLNAEEAELNEGNWLGESFLSSEQAENWIDTDGDGFSNDAELLAGTDPANRSSVPATTTQLSDRITFLQAMPANHWSLAMIERSLLPDLTQSEARLDSNGDGISDPLKIALGLDPMMIDSDGDGISDRRELDLGSDPAIPDAVLP